MDTKIGVLESFRAIALSNMATGETECLFLVTLTLARFDSEMSAFVSERPSERTVPSRVYAKIEGLKCSR